MSLELGDRETCDVYAPLTPEEERALREAWARIGPDQARRLLTTLDEVRFERDAVQALHEDACKLLAATRAELDAAWQATGVASAVRGLTTLADVVTTLRESAAELRRERASGGLWEAMRTAYAQLGVALDQAEDAFAGQESD